MHAAYDVPTGAAQEALIGGRLPPPLKRAYRRQHLQASLSEALPVRTRRRRACPSDTSKCDHVEHDRLAVLARRRDHKIRPVVPSETRGATTCHGVSAIRLPSLPAGTPNLYAGPRCP